MGAPLHTPPWLVMKGLWPEFGPRNPWHGWVVILWCYFTCFTPSIVFMAPFCCSHSPLLSFSMRFGLQPYIKKYKYLIMSEYIYTNSPKARVHVYGTKTVRETPSNGWAPSTIPPLVGASPLHLGCLSVWPFCTLPHTQNGP